VNSGGPPKAAAALPERASGAAMIANGNENSLPNRIAYFATRKRRAIAHYQRFWNRLARFLISRWKR